MISRRRLIQLSGAAAGAVTLGVPGVASAQNSLAPGDHVPATELDAIAQLACVVPPNHDPNVIKVVLQVARNLNVNAKVLLSGFEAGWVESHMNNLACGDRDSLGVFQQRPSQGWGTPEQIMNVSYAANAYFTRAVVNDRNNPGYTPGQLAQSVQRSGYPDRYDQSEAKARALIAEAERLLGPASALPGSWAYEWSGQQHVFGRGGSGDLAHWFWDPQLGVQRDTWGSGPLQGELNGFAFHDEQHVFGRSPTDTLAHWWWAPGEGVQYENWSGECLSDPATFHYPRSNQQHAFAKGSGDALYHWWWTPGDGQLRSDVWGRQGFQGNPLAFAYGDQQHVLARSVNDTLAHWYWAPGQPVQFEDWGGECLSDPSGFVFGPASTQHVFAKGADDALFHWWWTPGGGGLRSDVWGRQGFQGTPASFAFGNQQHAFARSVNDTLAHWWWEPGQPVRHDDWGGQCHSDPAGFHFGPANQQHVFAKAANGELFHWFYDLVGGLKRDTWGGQFG